MPDPYEVDDEGNPVAESEPAGEAEFSAAEIDPAAEPDPAAEAALRGQIEGTLRAMALSTLVGLIVIAIVAIVVPSIRSVMILVGIVYLVTSLAARWYLRRKFLSRLKVGEPPA